MSQSMLESVRLWMPELMLSIGAMAVILIGAFFRRRGTAVAATWLSILAAAASLWAVPPALDPAAFSGLLTIDRMSVVFRWVALGVLALVTAMASCSSDVEPTWTGEYLGLLLVIGVGLMLMAEANHLLMVVVSMEMVSLSSYALVAFVRDARASEAALKYLLFGALSSGIMLFGVSLLYGMTGTLSLPSMREALGSVDVSTTGPLMIAVALMLAGLAFKISMVPFHLWTPDVYEGAPIPVTAMLSVGPKAAGIALLIRVLHAVGPLWELLAPLLLVLTVITMTLGNVAALVQSNIKRLLAYSTIGQVGYVLIGLAVNTPTGIEAVVVYLAAYLFMNLGAFACVVAVCNETGNESVEAFRGLAHRSPVLALCCALFLLSLAGMPPLLGFVGKFLLFGSAIESHHVVLAVAGALNSAIALYYYVNIIRLMYLAASDRPGRLRPAWPLRLALGLCAVATLAIGIFPNALLTRVRTLTAGIVLSKL